MIYLDVGHGWNNRKPGAFDPGAVGGMYSEAELVRTIGQAALERLEGAVQRAPDGPLAGRILWQRRMLQEGDALLSLHMNASGTGLPSGVEVLYAASRPELREAAARTSRTLAETLHLPDRGAKPDTDSRVGKLGILRGHPTATLLLAELGFVDNAADRAAVLELGVGAVVAALRGLM